jgi:outer membrane protein
VAAQRQQVVVNEGERELALRRLARKVGRQRLGDLEPPGPIPVPPSPEVQLVSQALEQRLEMITLRHQLEAAGLYVKIEKGAWLPELEASAQYFQQKAQFPSEDWISATLSLKIPIYDGGLTSARVAQAREDLFEVELLERELRKAITDQVESAAIQLRSAVAGLEAARQSREAAAEAHRQLEHAYRVGEATATDLLSATASLTDAENSLIIARTQRQLASIGLRHAVGESPLPDLDLALDTTTTEPAEISDEDRGE